MPNHITNLLTVTGDPERVAAFRVAHVATGERGPFFDFETIIPKPQCVKDTSRDYKPGDATIGDAQVELYARALIEERSCYITERTYHWIPASVQTWGDVITWLESKCPTIAKWGRARLACAAETGYPGWYEWSVANWGTKWGSYQYRERSHDPGRFVFQFQTAWASPLPIFDKLADVWPELTIAVESIDEGGGEYEGHYHGTERRFDRVDDDAERYRRVYGRDQYREDDDGEEVAS